MPSSWATILGLSWLLEIDGFLPRQEGAFSAGFTTWDGSTWTGWSSGPEGGLEEWGAHGGRWSSDSLTGLFIFLTGSKACIGFSGLGLNWS